MTWYPPIIKKSEQTEEFDSIAEVFEECDQLELKCENLKDQLKLAIWGLERYVDADHRNLAFDVLVKIEEMGRE